MSNVLQCNCFYSKRSQFPSFLASPAVGLRTITFLQLLSQPHQPPRPFSILQRIVHCPAVKSTVWSLRTEWHRQLYVICGKFYGPERSFATAVQMLSQQVSLWASVKPMSIASGVNSPKTLLVFSTKVSEFHVMQRASLIHCVLSLWNH